MRPLDNPVRHYSWGSRSAIAVLQGRPHPTVEPEAELWMGAHPSDPSRFADDGSPLSDLVAVDPVSALGESTMAQFGARLPFLLKVLAVREPLSLQVHPDSPQASAGFAAEEAAGVPRDAFARTYVDPHHKPELVVALTDFDALCGFRDPAGSAELLASLDVPMLSPVIAALRGADSDADRLRAALELLLRWPIEARAALVEAVAAAPGAPLAASLARLYPGDVGVVVALLLNQVRLAPDEALFLPAGVVHAYLAGVGVEVMAASDNVLRCGLTPKHVNADELMRIVRYEVTKDPVLRATPLGHGLAGWPVPVAEFSLVKAVAGGGATVLPAGAGPRIVTCVQGKARLISVGQSCSLDSGESVFVGGAEPAVELHGDGVVFQVAVPA